MKAYIFCGKAVIGIKKLLKYILIFNTSKYMKHIDKNKYILTIIEGIEN